MRFFKKRPERPMTQGETLHLEGTQATATRAVVATVYGMLPTIEFRVLGSHGEQVVMHMTLDEASKFVQQGIHAIQAATPDIPRPSYNTPFG